MPSDTSAAGLRTVIADLAATTGSTVNQLDGLTVKGECDVIKSQWFLGGRKVSYRFSCRLDEPAHRVAFRESATESSWGMPPPSFTVQTLSQSGTRVSTSRRDTSVGGGGHLDYGQLREAIDAATREAGWEFMFEPGRAP